MRISAANVKREGGGTLVTANITLQDGTTTAKKNTVTGIPNYKVQHNIGTGRGNIIHYQMNEQNKLGVWGQAHPTRSDRLLTPTCYKLKIKILIKIRKWI